MAHSSSSVLAATEGSVIAARLAESKPAANNGVLLAVGTNKVRKDASTTATDNALTGNARQHRL